MAGGANLPSGSSGKKSLDADINLVPFIDLLSVCICFLLMTAVWIQVGSMEVKQAQGTEAQSNESGMELSLSFTSPTGLQAQLKKGGRVVRSNLFQGTTVAELRDRLEVGLPGLVLGAEAQSNTHEGLGHAVASARVTPKAGVSYGDLIGVMDVLRKHRIVNLGVVPVGG